MTLKLRAATPDDLPSLTDILLKSKASWGYSAAQMAEVKTHDPVTPDQFDRQHVVIAETHGRPIAYLALETQDDKTLLVDHLFVLPDAQAQGLGSLLLARAEDYARRHGLQRLYLESDSHAEAFYVRRGFCTIGRRQSQLVPDAQVPLMDKKLPPAVHCLRRTDVTVADAPWDFETTNQDAITQHFSAAKAKNPHLWNGRLLILTDYSIEDGVFSGTCRETSFAAFLAWRNWGAPTLSGYNLCACTVLRATNGALAYGVMGSTTATAGLIYPPGGNIDPEDMGADGRVDVQNAIGRELEEETGFLADEGTLRATYAVQDGARVAIANLVDVDMPGEHLRQRILEHTRASGHQELSDIRLIRSRADLDNPAIVSHARMMGRHLLG